MLKGRVGVFWALTYIFICKKHICVFKNTLEMLGCLTKSPHDTKSTEYKSTGY